MSKKWKRIKGSLEHSEGRSFEDACLPFLRAIWWDIVVPEPLRTFDRGGVDILRWEAKDGSTIPLAVQCKGFKAKEFELGKNQISQCRKSIKKFKASGFSADEYVFIINRFLKNEEFRNEINSLLASLKDSGQANKVVLWSFQDLVKAAQLKVRERCYQYLSLTANKASAHVFESPVCAPLEAVPLEVSKIVLTPNKKESEIVLERMVEDPAKIVVQNEISNISLLLGKAGYGKTTSALRSRSFTPNKVFYLSAASLPSEVNNKSSLIKEWIKLDDFWDDILDSDFRIIDELVSLAIDYVLKVSDVPVTLILDALDESIYFSRLHGLQNLFNQVSDFRIPIVLIAREEFWESKQKHFASFFGTLAQKREKIPKRTVAVVRLKDWEKAQILSFAARFHGSAPDGQKDNIKAFVDLVEADRYGSIYGDIPKRPLFLNYILESVAAEGVRKKTRARLFYDWAVLKVRRDIENPIFTGGDGRPPILQGRSLDADQIVRVSFRAMKLAASKMLIVEGGQVKLLPSCDIEQLRKLDPEFSLSLDTVSLLLHSLLEHEKSSPEAHYVRFGHRTYQEFFLALHIRENDTDFAGLELPESVLAHMIEIEAERI